MGIINEMCLKVYEVTETLRFYRPQIKTVDPIAK